MTAPETRFDGPGFRRALLISVVAALAVLPVATLAIAVLVDSDDVAAWLTPRLESALNRDVAIGGAGVALLPSPGLRLKDVRVGGGAEGVPSVVSVDQVHLETALLPLFTGKVAIDELRLRGLAVHLSIDEQGVSNFGDLVPEADVIETARRGPVGFRIERVAIDDASLTYFDGPRARSFAVTGADGAAEVFVEPDGHWRVETDVVADSLLMRLGGLTDEIIRTDAPTLTVTARGDRSLDRIEISESSIELYDQRIGLDGRITRLSEVDPHVDLRLSSPDLELPRFTAMVPHQARATRVPALEGGLDLSLAISGRLKEGPGLTGVVGLNDVGLRLGGDPVLAAVNGRIAIRPELVRLDSLSGRFAEGPFTVDGSIERESRTLVASVHATPDLERLQTVGFRPFGASLSGTTELWAEVIGPLATPDSLLWTGAAAVRGVRAEHEAIGVPVYAPSAEFALTGREVRWSDVTVLVGDDPLFTSGSSDHRWLRSGDDAVPTVEASFTGERLDLEAVLPPEPTRPDMTYARVAFAHLGGREIDGVPAPTLVERSGLTRPSELPVHGRIGVALQRVTYRDYELEGLSATLDLSDTTLVVSNAAFDAWSGGVRLALTMGVGDRIDEPFALTFAADSVDAATFLASMSPLGGAIEGRADVELELSGATDTSLMPVLASLAGSGSLVVRDGAVAGTGVNLALSDFLGSEAWTDLPFGSWRTELAVAGGMLEVRRSELRSAVTEAELTGDIGLGGAVDLAVGLSIPADQLEGVSLRRTGVAQSMLERLQRTASPLELGIRISGTLEGPTIEPDALAAAEQVAARRR